MSRAFRTSELNAVRWCGNTSHIETSPPSPSSARADREAMQKAWPPYPSIPPRLSARFLPRRPEFRLHTVQQPSDSGLISVPPDLFTASCLCSNGRNRPRSRPWHGCRDPRFLGSRLLRRRTRGAAGLSVALRLPAGSPPAVYGKAPPAQSQFWQCGQVGNSESSGLHLSLYSSSSSGLSALGY